MKFNLYSIRDVVSGTYIGIGFAETDGAFMRDTLQRFLQIRPLDELEYYQVGEFNSDDGKVFAVEKRECSKDSYKFPEAPARQMTKEDVIALANELEKRSK